MIGRDRIANLHQTACTGDRRNQTRLGRHVDKERRLLDVGALVRPVELLAAGRLDRLPFIRAVEDVGVLFDELVLIDALGDQLLDFDLTRPNVAQIDVVALLIAPDRLGHQINIDGAGNGIRDDKRRRGEIVRLDIGVDSALEVSVARQNGGHDEILLIDSIADRLGQRAGVSDARCAAIPDEIKAERFEVPHEPRPFEVIGNNLGAGRERGFDPRFALQGELVGLCRDNPCPDHDTGIGRVRATGDGGDNNVAVFESKLRAVAFDHRGALFGGERSHRGRLGIGSTFVRPGIDANLLGGRGLVEGIGQRTVPFDFHLVQRHAILRALRTGQRRLDRVQIEFERG